MSELTKSQIERITVILNEVPPPKPKKKIIDLSNMVGSDIDVEVDFKSIWISDKLIKINDGKYYTVISLEEEDDGYYKKCRIRQDHWHHWNGGDCPLPEGLIITVETRMAGVRTKTVKYTTSHWRWKHKGDSSDIIAFKVLGCAENYKYEWMEE